MEKHRHTFTFLQSIPVTISCSRVPGKGRSFPVHLSWSFPLSYYLSRGWCRRTKLSQHKIMWMALLLWNKASFSLVDCLQRIYGEEQKLGKHPSPYAFPDSRYSPLPGFPEPVEFDRVALNWSTAPPSFLHSWRVGKGFHQSVLPCCMKKVFIFTFICLWLTSSYGH